MPLDGNATASDYVSYPDGDTEDVVNYDVTGLNNNQALSGGLAQLVIVAQCSAEGAENIVFIGDGVARSCGQTVINRTVNADSRTGAVRIQAVGGSDTYVQWRLNATATRLN